MSESITPLPTLRSAFMKSFCRLLGQFAFLLIVGPLAGANALGPAAMDSYSQTVVIKFKSEATAVRARPRIADLYHDYKAAFSTRMDDSNLNDLRVAEIMARYGQKGTFNLNDPNHWWQDNTETNISVSGDLSLEVPKRLLAGGNSIGGHSLNHEMMPALSKNYAFREILAARVSLETHALSPNVVFVYPFIFYQSRLRDGTDRVDLEEMLRRAGYYSLSEDYYNRNWDSGFLDGVFITCDAASDKSSEDSTVAQATSTEVAPLFLVTMHAWVQQWGGPNYPKLEDIYRRWSGRTDWWYCNQNQYSAYRYQALHTQLATFVDGDVMRIVVTRCDPADLGDWTPLTFLIEGAKREDVVSIQGSDAEIRLLERSDLCTFDLFHDRNKGPIEKYESTDNTKNDDRFSEGAGGHERLRALLYRKGVRLILTLHNESSDELKDIRVVFRVPLRWENGTTRRCVGSLAGGAWTTIEIPLIERTDGNHYADGSEYNVAQIDFNCSGRERLYASCTLPEIMPADSFARNGFWVLGPLSGDRDDFDPFRFALPFLEGASPSREYNMPWGKKIDWMTLPPLRASILDPDIIPTTGKPNIPSFYSGDPSIYFAYNRAHFILYGHIVSPYERLVHAVVSPACVKAMFLNGQKVEGFALNLKKGINDLRILYFPSAAISSTFDENNYGCYFRLIDDNRNRVEDIHFERPRLP